MLADACACACAAQYLSGVLESGASEDELDEWW